MQYSIAFCCRLEAANDVTSGMFVRQIVPDKAAEFRDHGFNISGEEKFHPKPSEASFRQFVHDNFRSEVAGVLIFGKAVLYLGAHKIE